jgi:hypothetical protein
MCPLRSTASSGGDNGSVAFNLGSVVRKTPTELALIRLVGFEVKQVQVCDPGVVQLSEYERLWQLVDNKSNG